MRRVGDFASSECLIGAPNPGRDGIMITMIEKDEIQLPHLLRDDII